MSGKPTLRNNQDGTCNCRPLSNGCFFQELDGSRCRCKCHTKPTFETTPVTFESDKPISSHTNQPIEIFRKWFRKTKESGAVYDNIVWKRQYTEEKEVWKNDIEEFIKYALSQTEQECDKKWGEKALGNEKLLKDIHRLELDAISCMSLEKFMKWSDDRKEKSKTEALQDLLNNK